MKHICYRVIVPTALILVFQAGVGLCADGNHLEPKITLIEKAKKISDEELKNIAARESEKNDSSGRGPGPQTDYGIVYWPVVRTSDTTFSNWTFCWDQSNPDLHVTNQAGPFRLAIVPNPGVITVAWRSWHLRDNFTWIGDGLSNQILIGEKHIPINRLGLCDGETSGSFDKNEIFAGDCSYLNIDNWGVTSSGRSFSTWQGELALAKGPYGFMDDDNTPTHHYAFGSYRIGVCNFLYGDGSVSGLSVSTPHSILAALSNCRNAKTLTP